MTATSIDLKDATALVVDGNPQSRATLVALLREQGLIKVTQCGKLADARSKLEFTAFDLVVCEQYFERESTTGQDLLDDLRQKQLLPFYTVFIMVTSEATYSSVAEAAESAMDAYLLKPYTPSALTDRIRTARQRKNSLQEIFAAIDDEKYEEAAAICKTRFEKRDSYWLYAARIGAELMLRTGNIADAQAMYEAVVEAKTLPWAKLGVARTQMEAGHPQRATTTLQGLIETDPGYTDAYDIMGRAQFELGNFSEALATYKMAAKLTPTSVNRTIKHGMMAFYAGDREAGIEELDRATRFGLDSKLFDPQVLVILAFARIDDNNVRGLTKCAEQLTHLANRNPDSSRLKKLIEVVAALQSIHNHQTARALDEVRRMSKLISSPDFDFEAASNLLALMTRLAVRSIQLNEVDAAVEVIGLRFCTSKALTELLSCACVGRPEFVKRIRAAHTDVLKLTEQAMTLSLKGDPQAAVERLLEEGARTQNAKIIESSHLVLQRYQSKIEAHTALLAKAQELRERFRTTDIHAGLGEHNTSGRAAGGMSLPSGFNRKKKEGLLNKTEPSLS